MMGTWKCIDLALALKQFGNVPVAILLKDCNGVEYTIPIQSVGIDTSVGPLGVVEIHVEVASALN